MYNEDLNNQEQLQPVSDSNINEVYHPETSYEYPTYSGNETTEEDSNKKGPIFIIIIIVALLILGLLGFLGYKYFFNKDKEINIDSIRIEGGSLNPEFSTDLYEYNIESINDSVKLICSYKGKKVVTEGCNQSILLTIQSSTSIQVKTKDKVYIFNVVKISEDSPIIDNVVVDGSKDWTKSVTLIVDAIFKKEQHSEAYSFDGGKTWQKENSKKINVSGDINIVVRDVEGNLSSVYVEKIQNVDASVPVFNISISNKQAVITAKDSDSGITNLMVTKSSHQPSKIDEIKLTKETILKYTASSSGDYYVWAKDKAGNVTSKKFTIGSSTDSNNNSNNNNSNNNNSNNNNNSSVVENISVSIHGNVSYWTDKVTLTIDATTNKSGVLEYSFDGGKTFSINNGKTFTSNQTVTVVVKNNATGKTTSKTEKIEYIDNIKPSCSSISGASTEWTNNDRMISVTCSDNGSGCKEAKVSKTFNKTTKTDIISIYDKAGNKNDCPVNVYVDKTPPTVNVDKEHRNALKQIYKFQLFVTDNESGINLESMKYKQRILKNGVDKLWLNKFDGTKELSASNGVYYSYRFTKETGIYKYFTVSVSDNVGNVNEFEFAIEE